MIAAVVALAAVAVVLVGVLCVMLHSHEVERASWTNERRSLVDRVIAQHTGEVIALDRAQRPRRERDHEPVAVEGLN